jgi:hypothetical protein
MIMNVKSTKSKVVHAIQKFTLCLHKIGRFRDVILVVYLKGLKGRKGHIDLDVQRRLIHNIKLWFNHFLCTAH